jgi:hypothetical protein
MSFKAVGYGTVNSVWPGSFFDRRKSSKTGACFQLAGMAAGTGIGVVSACVAAGVHRQLARDTTQVQSLHGEISTAKACLKPDPHLSIHKGHKGKPHKNNAENQDPRANKV